MSKVYVRGEKIKSRKYCKQRRSIPEIQIHLPFLIVLLVENIPLLCFLLVRLYVSLIRTKRWQLPKRKAIPCFIHMVEMCGQIQQEKRIWWLETTKVMQYNATPYGQILSFSANLKILLKFKTGFSFKYHTLRKK